MVKKFALGLMFFIPVLLFGQNEIVQEGEFGIGIGGAHYFGDLNTKAKLNRPKFAGTVFFRKNFGSYVGARLAASYARIGYSDTYNTHNEHTHRRNLSFNSNVWEIALQGDFNFYKFIPGEPSYNFTPYITLGIGVFNYDPFALFNNQKYFLRDMGTEGQGSTLYPDRKPYPSIAVSIPFGVGFKYTLNQRTNVGFEILYRFTTSDYIDDVSKTYVSSSVFPSLANGSPSIAQRLSDRSYELGEPIGVADRQRGNSQQKDNFATALFFITFNLQSYRCITAN